MNTAREREACRNRAEAARTLTFGDNMSNADRAIHELADAVSTLCDLLAEVEDQIEYLADQ